MDEGPCHDWPAQLGVALEGRWPEELPALKKWSSEMPRARTVSWACLSCAVSCVPAAVGFSSNSRKASPKATRKAPPVHCRSLCALGALSTPSSSTPRGRDSPRRGCCLWRFRLCSSSACWITASAAFTAAASFSTAFLKAAASCEPLSAISASLSSRQAARSASWTESRPSSMAHCADSCSPSSCSRARMRCCCSAETLSSKLRRAAWSVAAAASACPTSAASSASSSVALGAGSSAL
mmetsp:Transcript_37495/g.108032  ORF Transcript_37495/g.108032 Transcript_37495/m.108032 type:complete len:239 (+) Transcript_37495:196-912(+)